MNMHSIVCTRGLNECTVVSWSFSCRQWKLLQVNFELPEGLSPQLESLLRRILVADPARRPTMQQLMADPWVRSDMPPGMMLCNDKVRKDSLHTSSALVCSDTRQPGN